MKEIVEKKIYEGTTLVGKTITINFQGQETVLETALWGKYQGELGVCSQKYLDCCAQAGVEPDWSIVSRDCVD